MEPKDVVPIGKLCLQSKLENQTQDLLIQSSCLYHPSHHFNNFNHNHRIFSTNFKTASNRSLCYIFSCYLYFMERHYEAWLRFTLKEHTKCTYSNFLKLHSTYQLFMKFHWTMLLSLKLLIYFCHILQLLKTTIYEILCRYSISYLVCY